MLHIGQFPGSILVLANFCTEEISEPQEYSSSWRATEFFWMCTLDPTHLPLTNFAN